MDIDVFYKTPVTQQQRYDEQQGEDGGTQEVLFVINGNNTLATMTGVYRAVRQLWHNWESSATISGCKIRVYIYARLMTTCLMIPELPLFCLTLLSMLRYVCVSIRMCPKYIVAS